MAKIRLACINDLEILTQLEQEIFTPAYKVEDLISNCPNRGKRRLS